MRRCAVASAALATVLLLPDAVTASTLGGDSSVGRVEQHAATSSGLMRKEGGSWQTKNVEEKVEENVEDNAEESDDEEAPDVTAELAEERQKTAALAQQMEELKSMLVQALNKKDTGAEKAASTEQAPPGWSDASSMPLPAAPPQPAGLQQQGGQASQALPLPAAPQKKSIPNPTHAKLTPEQQIQAQRAAAATQAMEKEAGELDKLNDRLSAEAQWMPGKAKAAAVPVTVPANVAPPPPPPAPIAAALGSDFQSSGAETTCATELANFGCRCFARDPGWDACDMYPCVDCTTKLNSEDMHLLPSDALFLRLPSNEVEDFRPEVLDKLPKLHGMLVADGVKIMGLNDRPADADKKPTNQEFAALLQSMSVPSPTASME